jgi:hypothetical protein
MNRTVFRRFIFVAAFLGLLVGDVLLARQNTEQLRTIQESTETIQKQTEVIKQQRQTIDVWQTAAQDCADVDRDENRYRRQDSDSQL